MSPTSPTVAVAPRRRRPSKEIIERLLHAAGEEFRQSGYAGATTATIARKADTTEAQLFRYFRSKAELFREAIFSPLDRHFAEFQSRHALAPADTRSAREAARRYITELQDFIAGHSEMLVSLFVAQTYDFDTMRDAGGIGSLSAYFDHGAAMLPRKEGVTTDPRLIVRVSFAAVLASVIFKGWLFRPDMAEADVSDAIIAFVMDGIAGAIDPAP